LRLIITADKTAYGHVTILLSAIMHQSRQT
jgi:hypothetical protein